MARISGRPHQQLRLLSARQKLANEVFLILPAKEATQHPSAFQRLSLQRCRERVHAQPRHRTQAVETNAESREREGNRAVDPDACKPLSRESHVYQRPSVVHITPDKANDRQVQGSIF